MEDKKAAIKITPNRVYWITLDKKFGEYDNKYGRSYGYGIKMRTNLDEQPTEETWFASEAVYNLIKGSRIKEGVEFELILNEKDGRKFYTLDSQTTNQWLANNQNKDAETPTTTEQRVEKGKDELDALFGEVEDNITKQQTSEIKHSDNHNTIRMLWNLICDAQGLIEKFASAEGVELKDDRVI